MELFDNVTKIVKQDMETTITKESRVSIAAACFSIYAYKELKKQLEGVKELRFIFTSPSFTTEKVPKEKREFYIPRLSRERSLYGTEFEIKLRNELSQKAIAKECAEWIRRKVSFKSNVTNAVYDGCVRQIAGERLGFKTADVAGTTESLKDAVERDLKRQRLVKEIATLESKIAKEKQFNKQVELNAELKRLRSELEEML